MTTLTPDRFDTLTRAPAHAREDKIIWTAKAIGRRIGRSEDYVRKVLAHLPGSPIFKQGNRLYSFEHLLLAYLMRDQNDLSAAEMGGPA
jgi:hypothetical protein